MATIDTNGWDLVYATNYTNVNTEITAQWPTLIASAPSLSKVDETTQEGTETFSANLTLGPWEVTQGGSGNSICLKLPITSGTFQGILPTPYDLTGQSISATLQLQWVPQPNVTQFTISQDFADVMKDLGGNTTVTTNILDAFANANAPISAISTIAVMTPNISWKITDPSSGKSFYVCVTSANGDVSLLEVYQFNSNTLIVCPNSAITPVTVVSVGSIESIDGSIVQGLVSQYLDKHMEDFRFIFATVDVVTSLATNELWGWLQPTTNGYAVVEPLENATNDTCVFGILSMVNGRTNPKAALQVDANAIATGCTSSLIISPTMFLTNMLAPAAYSAFTGASQGDFTIDLKNLSVVNTNTVTWGSVELQKGKSPVSLSVAPNDFSMSVQTDRVTIQFSNLSYPLYELDMVVGHSDINFVGQFNLGLNSGSNNNKTLWFSPPQDQLGNIDVSSVMNQTYYTVESAIGYLNIALSVVGLASTVASKIATKAAEGAAEDAGQLTADASAEDIQAAFKKILSDPQTRKNFVEQAGDDGAKMLEKTTVNIKRANLWSSVAKWSGTLAGITGVVAGKMQTLESTLEQASQNKWEHTPAFSNFADLAISRYSFAGLTDLNVSTAGLAESFYIGFTSTS
ncbi:clostridium P-47 protein-domain-containing protein [Fusarium flagelliforme]|uniref:clostridium P-47 protein-domain-containing protein n=1 Tax=Fusarium flagelliforme TaxID=2675880 RepID=UPI001E8DFC12|nr:clostridium P-47 protein-domain-containing protein [Fusarium flagelliforme]KAH7184822.1 clostridium P-47 protein-domain-containing protein [Fusarium flagelliforme]